MSVLFFKSRSTLLPQEIPDRSEQNIAREYCLYHDLERPNVKITTLLKYFLFFELLILAISFGLYILSEHLGISFSLQEIYFFVSGILSIVFLKKICILLIKTYQHYASEKMRRRCVLMPTCSEYALLAVQKYGVIRGLYKTYIRLTKKCLGSVYSIDYP